MKFCSENASDIEKYFRNSYMKFPEFAGDLVHFVERVHNDRVTGHFYKDGEKTQFQFDLYPDGEGPVPEVEYILPTKSWFQHGEDAYFLYRLPARQYKKGITSENTAIIRLTGSGDKLSPCSIQYELIAAYVAKPAFPTLSAIAGTKFNSHALGPRIAVNKVGRIYIDTLHVATVDWTKRRVQMHEALFSPEVARVAGAFEITTGSIKALRSEEDAAKRKYKAVVIDDYGNDVHF